MVKIEMKGFLLLVSACLLWTLAAANNNTTTAIATTTATNLPTHPRILLHNISTSFVPESHARFSCEMPGVPGDTEYIFWKGDMLASRTHSNTYFIAFLEASDSATYACSIVWGNGEMVKSANEIEIKVEIPVNSTLDETPHLIVLNVSTTALFSQGDKAVLWCEGLYVGPGDWVELKVNGVFHSREIGNKVFYLQNVQVSDTGLYTCDVVLSGITRKYSNNSVFLQVWDSPMGVSTPRLPMARPHIVSVQNKTTLLEGDTVDLVCAGLSIGSVDRVELSIDGAVHSVNVGSKEFHLKDLRQSDSGFYTCAVLYAGRTRRVSHNSVYITVYGRLSTPSTVRPWSHQAPQLVLHNISTTFVPDSHALITCDGNGLSYMFWKGDVLISQKENNRHFISFLKPSDNGIYWCSIRVKTGENLKSSNNITIKVEYSANSAPNTPFLFLHNFTSMAFYYRGEHAHFSCEGQYVNPGDVVELLRNGVAHFTNVGKKDLYINNIQVSDTGDYTCAVLTANARMISNNSVFVQVWNNSNENTTTPPTTRPSIRPETEPVPRILLHNITTSFLPGSIVNFSCEAPGAPKDQLYTFWKGDYPIFENRSKHHHISDLTISDSGKYWCSIPHKAWVNLKSSNAIEITLNINSSTNWNYYTPRIVVHDTKVKVMFLFKPGDRLNLSCEGLSISPVDMVEWTKNGVVLSVQEQNTNFFIYHLNEYDTGNYRCAKIAQDTRMPSNNSAFIQVWNPTPKRFEPKTTPNPLPWIRLDNPTPNLSLGDTVYLTCKTDNKPSGATVQFWRGNRMIASSVGNNTYMKYNLDLSDGGNYWCALVTAQGRLDSYNSVTINVRTDRGSYYNTSTTTAQTIPATRPTIVLRNPTTSVIYEGMGAHFTCEAPGYGPYDRYQLTKYDSSVTQQIGKDFFLFNLKVNDSGLYSCAVMLPGYRQLYSYNTVNLDVRRGPFVANTTTTASYLPRIRLQNSNPNFTQGQTASLYCHYALNPYDAYYQFWKDDVTVASTYNSSFQISNLKPSDSGLYWCSVLTRDGKVKSANAISIYVRKDPNPWHLNTTTPRSPTTHPTIVLHKPMSYFYEGAGVHFSCEAPGWGSNYRYELNKYGSVVIQQKGKDFFLSNLNEADTGEYACAVLAVYRKIDSHNSVFIQVVAYPGHGDGDGGYSRSQKSVHIYPVLIGSLVLVVKALRMTMFI